MEEMIRVSHLSKHYGALVAVDDISFSVRRGELFAFLGPNGAGKSTTIGIICTLLQMTSGEVWVDGHEAGRDDAAVRRSIGIVFQDNILDDLLTVEENLLSRGALYGAAKKELQKRLAKVCEIMGIGDIAKRRYGKLSGGQKRRCEIARALMSDPKILILDEPTTGLDPQTRRNVWETIASLRRDLNMTVFLTTHYMEEAACADTVAIIDGGKIATTGTPGELKQRYSTDTLRIVPRDPDRAARLCVEKGYRCAAVSGALCITVKNSLEGFSLLKELEGDFTEFEMVRGNMDDVFMNVTGHEIREDM